VSKQHHLPLQERKPSLIKNLFKKSQYKPEEKPIDMNDGVCTFKKPSADEEIKLEAAEIIEDVSSKVTLEQMAINTLQTGLQSDNHRDYVD